MKKITIVALALGSLVFASASFATMQYQKEYKAKDATAKCATCHAVPMPKKDSHALNDFGKTVKAAQGADKKIDWTKVSAPKKG